MPDRTRGKGFRVETAGPDLDSRGELYGVGHARCSVRGGNWIFEKRYAGWTLGTVDSFHFIRVFRHATGVTPHQYLIGLRLRAAAERLRTTNRPITSVAFETGFDDISHFNRSFRRVFRMSPRC